MLYVPLWYRLGEIQVLKFFVALTNFGEKVFHNWMLSGLQKLRTRLYAARSTKYLKKYRKSDLQTNLD